MIEGLGERLEEALRECGDDPLKLRAFASRQISERLRAELAYESARRELAALKGEDVGAPHYPGLEWTAAHGWQGPFHLVTQARVPYPGFGPDIPPGSLPDIQVPAAKAICGQPFRGYAHTWPDAKDVCPECAAEAYKYRPSSMASTQALREVLRGPECASA